jgi:hypothetical protein
MSSQLGTRAFGDARNAMFFSEDHLPIAIVADGGVQKLSSFLDQLLPFLQPKVFLWLSGQNGEALNWACSKNIEARRIDEGERIPLAVPTLPFSLEITRCVLDPVKLLFVGRSEISEDGYLLGGVYSMLNLVPIRIRQTSHRLLSQIIMELYIRFSHFPAIVPTHHGNPLFVIGDAWALDELILKNLPSKYGRLHSALRRYVLPPPPPSFAQEYKVLPKSSPERVCPASAIFSSSIQFLIKAAAAGWRAGLILQQAMAYRLKSRWPA